MRKSCEIEASSVLRTRSVSAALRAATISRASEARSSAVAVCSASVSSMVRASGSRRDAGSPWPIPMTPRGPRVVFSGRKSQGTAGSVAVAAPAGSPCWCAQRAAVMAAVSSASNGGEAPLELQLARSAR